jgi:acyl-CoA reductase-like NAD-dependent aldehyde dehydrogenase
LALLNSGQVRVPNIFAYICTCLALGFQICIAVKRIYVHRLIYPEFLAAVVAATKSFLVGDGFDDKVFLGPIQNSMQYERVQEFLKDIEDKKLKVAVGGNQSASGSDLRKGYFVYPTIIDNPSDDSRIVTEEPFG